MTLEFKIPDYCLNIEPETNSIEIIIGPDSYYSFLALTCAIALKMDERAALVSPNKLVYFGTCAGGDSFRLKAGRYEILFGESWDRPSDLAKAMIDYSAGELFNTPHFDQDLQNVDDHTDSMHFVLTFASKYWKWQNGSEML